MIDYFICNRYTYFYIKSIATTQNSYLQAASDNVFDSQSFPSIHLSNVCSKLTENINMYL